MPRRLPRISKSLVFAAIGAFGIIANSSVANGAAALSVSVQGNRLVDANDNTLQLRGASIAGLESGVIFGGVNSFWSSAGFSGRPDFARLADWKMNAVRLPLNEDSWLGVSVKGMAGNVITLNGPAYRAEVAASVKAANAAGLYVILDLHWSAPAGFAANVQNPMADADNSVNFWTSVGNAFKANPAVVFELFNEPYIHSVEDSDGAFSSPPGGGPGSAANLIIRNGGVASYYFGLNTGTYGGSKVRVSYSWNTAGYQTLIDAVRASGAKNVILCGGNQYSNDLSWWGQSPPIDRTNQLGAALHTYPNGYFNPTTKTESVDAMLAPIVSVHPLVITEMGDEVAMNPAPFATKVLSWADLHGYSVVAWTWNPWGGANTLIRDAVRLTPTPGLGQTYHDWTLNHK
jgi:endoglucanase